jgi:glycosyltransferase involved in cell wall biosynthesis
MKILYLNNLYDPYIKGGAEISLQLLVKGMQKRGLEVVVVSYYPEKEMSKEEVNHVPVYRVPLHNIYWPYADQKPSTPMRLAWHFQDRDNKMMASTLTAILKQEKPDVVSCHNLAGWSAAVWKSIAACGIPVVQVLHDLYLLCANSNMYKNDHPCKSQCISCKVLRLGHPAKSAKVDAVVGISKSILDTFLAAGYFSNAHSSIIHNTRNIPNLSSPKHRLHGEKLKIGYLGTLSKIKGVEWLLNEFGRLEIDAELYLAGKGQEDYEKQLRLMSQDPRIKWMGHMDSAQFLESIDVLVVPSLWAEPLGMVAIEALAHHVPVIANKSGGLQETILERVNGLFCHADQPESLGNAILEIFQNPALYNKLSAAARDSVAEILDAERLLTAYEAVMEKVERKN